MEQMQYETREEYRYFAFISYSHKDMAWAKWVQKKLENYRLPTQLRKKYIGLPQKLAPVFRDETDLAGSVLNDALYRELARSQYLIVICSPNSMASRYVNAEVEYFCSLGRQNRIIPLVVSGKPFSDDPWQECFPYAIRNIRQVLFGIDVQEHGRKDALSRLVATLLRLPADEVIMRERKRERLRRTIASISAAVTVLAAGVTTWYFTEHSAYYNAYTYVNEIPQGLYRLTKTQREMMSECYRITTRGGKVIRLETVNTAGTVTNSIISNVTTEYPIMEFGYDDAGQLITVVQRDEAGVEISRKNLSYTANGQIIVEFRDPETAEAAGLSGDMSVSLLGKDSDWISRINRQDNSYDADGRLVKSMYYWYNTFHPVCETNGVYGKAFTYNSAGQIETISNLDQNGDIFNCRYGWSTIRLEYDSAGNVIFESYYAADGSEAITEKGYHKMQLIYDSHGNVEEMVYVNPEGQPCNTDSGFSRQVFTRDSKGFMTGAKIYTAQGVPATNDNGVHERRYEYDQNGRMTYVTHLDRQGELAVDQSYGYTSTGTVYDEEGNVAERWMYDAEGQVICVDKFTYVDGRQVEAVYEDGNGSRIAPFGFCSCEYGYDELGNRSREAYFDVDGSPMMLTSTGYASRELDYDEFGNVEEIRCYGIDGQLCIINNGYAIARYTYTDGRRTGVEYFGTAEEPVLYSGGYHECRIFYNEIGVCTRLEYYGTDGKLIITADGYAIAEQACDAFGNVTEIRYLGEQAEPILRNGSHHKVKYQFDSHNNMTHIWYYGTDGKLIMHSNGYAALERDFDAYGDTIASRYYGAQNEPILYNGQYHELRYQRDAYRNFIHVWYYGTDGRLILVDGYAAAEMERDAYGNYLSVRYFGTENEPIMLDGEYHEVRNAYDTDGNITRAAYYDLNGNMIMTSDGYAAIEKHYNAEGKVTIRRYYGTQNEPILRDGEYHALHCEYDTQGNIARIAYYGTDGKMILLSDGYAAIEVDYDDVGNVTARRYYGTRNEPILLNGLYHEIRFEYDVRGNITAQRYYGTQNEPILRSGYHEVRWIYDAQGKEIGTAAYDIQGRLVYEEFYDNP